MSRIIPQSISLEQEVAHAQSGGASVLLVL